MLDIHHWEDTMKDKRKKTSFRDFLKEVTSWVPLTMFFNRNGYISRFPNSTRIKKVIHKDDYEVKRDNFTNEGKEYTDKIPFQDQVQELFQSIDFPNTISFGKNDNTDFADIIVGGKDVYLSSIVITGCENILYSSSVKDYSHWIINSVVVMDHSENVYMSTVVMRGYNIFYSRYIINSHDIWFSSNLIGCIECFGCNGLENQSYCINNKSYSKEDYFKYKKELLYKKSEYIVWHSTTMLKNGENFASKNVMGNSIIESENIENGNFIYHSEDGRNVILGGTTDINRHIYDACCYGSPYGNDYYGVTFAGGGDNYYLSCHISECSNIYYSYFLISCSYCLGCIGLKNKSFCILNKQYTKEEWYEVADKIFASMDKAGTLGDYFSGSMNPFYFNDTIAYVVDDSFTKEEVEKDGYMWREERIQVDIPEGAQVVRSSELLEYQGFDSDGHWQIDPEIMKKVIEDKNGDYYKIIPMEYDFLMKYALPLPEIHWRERIKIGFQSDYLYE